MRNIFILSILFTSLIALTSCEKEDAYAVKCIGDNCQQINVYPYCLNEHLMIVSNIPDIDPVFCPNGCVNNHCVEECTDGASQCLSDHLLQICLDGAWVNNECEEQCRDGMCIHNPPSCPEGEVRCSDSNVEICSKGQWKIEAACLYGCDNGRCIDATPPCTEGKMRCSDINVETCIDGQWMLTATCPYECDNGMCIDVPPSCPEGEARCSDANVETCTDGQWIITETCPYKCNNGKCVESCSGPDYCLTPFISQQCQNNEWVSVSCKYGCKDGKCSTEAPEAIDPRLTNRVCTRDDFDDDFSWGDCHGYEGNPLGTVCIASIIDSLYCLERCDPSNKPNYYCYFDYWSGAHAFAFTAECLQISDGTYALINTGASACNNDCTPDNGCDEVTKVYDNPGFIECDTDSYYCDGTIAYNCYGPLNCQEHGNKVCVQFGIPTYCATPCENEGDVRSECVQGLSNTATCVSDDHGTLSWQYAPPSKCSNGCNESTGLCR